MKRYTEKEAVEAILQNPKLAKKMAITGVSLQSYFYAIGRSEVTTSDLMQHLKVSAQYASKVLRELYEKGYLARRREVSITGGYEWIYWPAMRGKSND